jgi:hypothetical protein
MIGPIDPVQLYARTPVSATDGEKNEPLPFQIARSGGSGAFPLNIKAADIARLRKFQLRPKDWR